MMSLKSRLWPMIALVLGLLLVATGLSAPAEAATARSLTISFSPTAVNAGGKVSVSGRLTKSPSGSTVKIQRKVGTSWVTATSTKTTSAYGGYKVALTMPTTPGKYQFRSIAGASGSLLAATSATVTATSLRKVIVKAASNKSTIAVGETIELSGKAYPFVAGTVATIQRFNGIKWSTLVTTTLSKTGTFKRFIKPEATTTYRVLVPRTGLLATGISGPVKVLIPLGPVAPEITTTSLPAGATDKPYGQTLQVDGEDGVWAVTAGDLPDGLTLSSATGAITGTPTAGGTFTFTVTYSETDTLLSDSQELSILVRVSPRITTTSLPDATGFVTYGPVTLQKTGQAGAWSITAGTLPTGITFDTATGVLSGKPTIKTAGDYPLTFKYTETAAPQLSVTKQLTLHLDAAPNPVITTNSLPNATGFVTYSPFALQKAGNAGTWSITAGTLPTGMSFNTATGTISGKPTIKTAGDYPLTFRFTETESTTFATKDLTLHLNAAPNPVITTTSLPDATGFVTYPPFALQKTGNPGTWSIDTGTLPPGMSFDTATGTISGKPTVKDAGDYGLTFRFTETESTTFATKVLTLHLDAAANPVISTTTLPAGLINTAYDASLAVSTPRPGSWSIASGSLPTGVVLNPTTGALSGTPTVSGTFPVTFRFTETESGTTDTQALQIQIFSVPVVTTTAMPDALKDSTTNAYSFFLASSGGSSSKTWSLASGSLPNGLSLSATGKITGTATVNGDFTFTVQVTDTLTGATATKSLTIHVGPVAIFTATTPAGVDGVPYSLQFEGKPSNLGMLGWGIASGTLPPGLSFGGTGLLSGTPTTAGSYTFSVSYSVLLKPTRTRTYTLVIAP